MGKLTYEDYKSRLSIQDILVDAGYSLNKRDGLRYPSYIKTDSQGRRIRNDKFIVSGAGQCCFQPPVQRNYNIISFIKEFPEKFADYQPGMDKDRLVNLVCCRLLNEPVEDRQSRIVTSLPPQDPFRIDDYSLHHFKGDDRESQKAFYPYFASRGINLSAQYAFHHAFLLASKEKYGKSYTNLSFPMRIPAIGLEGAPKNTEIVGFEERGRAINGKAYKGMARGSNASEGMWIASPLNTKLENAKEVYVFESAYDAMAFYQLHTDKESTLTSKEKYYMKASVFASTGGNPSAKQLEGLMKTAKDAVFHVGFDMDEAGQKFAKQFSTLAGKLNIPQTRIIREEAVGGFKDWNDQLLAEIANRKNPLYSSNVPEELKAYVDSFRKDGNIPALHEVFHPFIYDDEKVDLLPPKAKELFNKYIYAKEEAMELCSSYFVHPDDKGEALHQAADCYRAFKKEMYNLLHVTEKDVAMSAKHAQKEEKQSKQIPVAEDQNESDDLEDNKKIQHDVDYTTSVDEQGNVEMDEETNDQVEKRHFHR
jgi:hypothetical protein